MQAKHQMSDLDIDAMRMFKMSLHLSLATNDSVAGGLPQIFSGGQFHPLSQSLNTLFTRPCW
jgi:hypothetical protein